MKKIYLVLFVILSVFVFSCKDNLISDDLSSNQNSGAGQVKVFVKQSRLIGPELSDVSWDVKLQKSGENNTISGKNENGYYLFSGLSDGTYNIRVSGKTGDVEKFTGSAVTTITNGNSVSVNVPIVAKKTDKENGDETERTGYATITMDMSEELLSLLNSMDQAAPFEAMLYSDNKCITASLVETSTDEQGAIEIFDNQKVKFVNISTTISYEIPTGYYYLTFSVLEQYGYTIKLKDNLVEIGDGFSTNIVLTENDYELVEELSESQIFYIDNSDNNHVYDTNNTTYAGLSLSNPLGFTNINDNISGTFYLISDVEAYKEDEENGRKIFPGIDGSTITSFGSNIFNIINNNKNFSLKFEGTFLKNIKLTNTTGAGFILLQCPIDGKVILDTPIVQDSNTDSTVLMSKSSKLVIGQNFSGELGICLSFEDWNIGDTVVTFENGVKPSNSNFYISEDADMPTGFASMFYIDDKGKLAQYDATSQWVNFAWNSGVPCLITQTQAKNKTYTRIIDSTGSSYLYGFNGISTYDEENQTWYFIANGFDLSGNAVSSLYKVSAPTEYTGSVTPEKICEVKLDETGQTSINVQDIYIYNGEIYLCNLSSYDTYNTYEVYVSTLNDIDFGWKYLHSTGDTVTALLVENDVIYIATTTSVDISGVTHSEIWRYKWDSDLDYTTAVDTYNQDGKIIPVPYYQTSSDEELKVGESFPEGSTFRITDLYSDGTSVYGLLANYIEIDGITPNDEVYMRGSVFKLKENTTTVNAIHYGLRNSLSISDISTAKQSFILPRKIVGIVNKKLIIADDGMIPDKTDCNLDRFILFDLDGTLSEIIDVNVHFTTSGTSSAFATGPLF